MYFASLCLARAFSTTSIISNYYSYSKRSIFGCRASPVLNNVCCSAALLSLALALKSIAISTNKRNQKTLNASKLYNFKRFVEWNFLKDIIMLPTEIIFRCSNISTVNMTSRKPLEDFNVQSSSAFVLKMFQWFFDYAATVSASWLNMNFHAMLFESTNGRLYMCFEWILKRTFSA